VLGDLEPGHSFSGHRGDAVQRTGSASTWRGLRLRRSLGWCLRWPNRSTTLYGKAPSSRAAGDRGTPRDLFAHYGLEAIRGTCVLFGDGAAPSCWRRKASLETTVTTRRR